MSRETDIDNNLRDVAVALITVAGGFLTAIVVARIIARSSFDSERSKRTGEVYASFLHDADALRDTVGMVADGGSPDDGWADHIAAGERKLSEIKLIAPKVGPYAARLWDANRALVSGVLRPTAPGTMDVDLGRYSELVDAYRVATLAFLDAAAKDLR